MNDRIIIKGFLNRSTETHTYVLPTPQKPIGFDYANRNIVSNEEEIGETSEFDLNVTSLGFMHSRKGKI